MVKLRIKSDAMDRWELRFIISTALTGISDVLMGFFMHWTGWHDWYWANFHTWGVVGFGMMTLAFWHYVLFLRDKKKNVFGVDEV